MQRKVLFGSEKLRQTQAKRSQRSNLQHSTAGHPIAELSIVSALTNDIQHGACQWALKTSQLEALQNQPL
jgi:hypothetical protein